MKTTKLMIAAFVACGVLAVSCKKDRTCKCTTTSGGVSTVTEYTIKETKKKAKDACEAYVSAGAITGVTISCELD